MRHKIPLHDLFFQRSTHWCLLPWIPDPAQCRILVTCEKENSVLKSKLVCRSQLKASFSIDKCGSVCIYASLFCLAWDLRWFSKRPRTPVSAGGCCSLLNGGSSSLPALPVNESIKELTDSRQDPLHHSPWCWNELWSLVWGEGPSRVWLFFFSQYYWDFLHLRQPSVSVSDEFAEHCLSFSPRGKSSDVKRKHMNVFCHLF